MDDSTELELSPPGITRLRVQKIAAGNLQQTSDPVAIEEALEIRIQHGLAGRRQDQSLAITMRTPGNDEELALGWLYTEGIIAESIITEPGITKPGITVESTGNSITIILPEGQFPDLTRSQRHSFMSSSCGICGKSSLDNLHTTSPVRTATDLSIPATLLYALPDLLREGQNIFDATGGLHAAGLFSTRGHLLALREDIGRHNALDKLIGHALKGQKFPLPDTILLLSGRACFELIQKAAMAGIRIVAAVGPPSSMAVQHAEESDITLVGFLRQQRFNIYSGAHRIHV